jgi:hypothetical protein
MRKICCRKRAQAAAAKAAEAEGKETGSTASENDLKEHLTIL